MEVLCYMDKQEYSFKECTVKHKKDCFEVFNNPRKILRIKKDNNKVVIELHNSLIGRFSINVHSELIKKVRNELE